MNNNSSKLKIINNILYYMSLMRCRINNVRIKLSFHQITWLITSFHHKINYSSSLHITSVNYTYQDLDTFTFKFRSKWLISNKNRRECHEKLFSCKSSSQNHVWWKAFNSSSFSLSCQKKKYVIATLIITFQANILCS